MARVLTSASSRSRTAVACSSAITSPISSRASKVAEKSLRWVFSCSVTAAIPSASRPSSPATALPSAASTRPTSPSSRATSAAPTAAPPPAASPPAPPSPVNSSCSAQTFVEIIGTRADRRDAGDVRAGYRLARHGRELQRREPLLQRRRPALRGLPPRRSLRRHPRQPLLERRHRRNRRLRAPGIGWLGSGGGGEGVLCGERGLERVEPRGDGGLAVPRRLEGRDLLHQRLQLTLLRVAALPPLSPTHATPQLPEPAGTGQAWGLGRTAASSLSSRSASASLGSAASTASIRSALARPDRTSLTSSASASPCSLNCSSNSTRSIFWLCSAPGSLAQDSNAAQPVTIRRV